MNQANEKWMVSSAYIAFFILGIYILHKLDLYHDFLMVGIMVVSGILIMFSKTSSETLVNNGSCIDYTNIIVFFIIPIAWVVCNTILRIV